MISVIIFVCFMQVRISSQLEQRSTYIINEFPSLSHAFSHIHASYPSIYAIIKQYEPIIGYFSLPTQMNLSQSILHQIHLNQTSVLFDDFNFAHFLSLEKITL